MLNLIGNYSLIFALLISFATIFFSYKNFKSTKNLNSEVFISISLQFFLICVSFITLLLAFVVSDFSNLAVYYNSSKKSKSKIGQMPQSLLTMEPTLMYVLQIFRLMKLMLVDVKCSTNQLKIL